MMSNSFNEPSTGKTKIESHFWFDWNQKLNRKTRYIDLSFEPMVGGLLLGPG